MKEKIWAIIKKNHLHHYGNADSAVEELNKLFNEDIIKIIKDAFDENIHASASITVLGVESYIEGKDDFFKEIEEKLKNL